MIELPEVAFDLQQLIDEVLRVTYQPCVWQRPWQGPCVWLSIIFPCSSTYTSNILAEISGQGPMCCALRWRRSLHEERGCLMKGVQHVLFLHHCWVPDVFLSLCCSTCIRLICLPVLAQEGPLSVGIAADDFATAAKAEFPK